MTGACRTSESWPAATWTSMPCRIMAVSAPIDSFAIGTHMTTSSDAPYLDCVYKLQEYAGRASRKTSEGKATWPGRKQVYRHDGADGRMAYDVLTLADDPQDGTALRSEEHTSELQSLAYL